MAPRWVSLSRLVWASFILTHCTAHKVDAQQDQAKTAAMTAVAEKWDAKTCLIAARIALAQGDLDGAAALAVRAENIPRGLIAMIRSQWSDTPAKVFRDIDVARAQQRADLLEQTHPEHYQYEPTPIDRGAEKKEPAHLTLALPPIVAVSNAGSTEPATMPKRLATSLPKDNAVVTYQRDFFGPAPPAPSAKDQDEVDLLVEAVKAFLVGDIESSRALAMQIKKQRQAAGGSKDDHP
jgi:hypothetical protein